MYQCQSCAEPVERAEDGTFIRPCGKSDCSEGIIAQMKATVTSRGGANADRVAAVKDAEMAVLIQTFKIALDELVYRTKCHIDAGFPNENHPVSVAWAKAHAEYVRINNMVAARRGITAPKKKRKAK
jgi:hypothetical protein